MSAMESKPLSSAVVFNDDVEATKLDFVVFTFLVDVVAKLVKLTVTFSISLQLTKSMLSGSAEAYEN